MRRVSLSLLLVFGVAGPTAAMPDPELGTAVQANIAAMAVDLTPDYANVVIEGGSGYIADGAASRYKRGQVKPLLRLDGRSNLGVAAVTGGGGGGTSGGAGGGAGGGQGGPQ